MKNVIHIYGASGSGTSTLGRKICEELGYKFMDTDDYFWLPTNPKYTTKRSVEERIHLMKRDILEADNVVISGSLVDWGDELIPLFTLAIRLVTDTEIRIERLKTREKQEFGDRIMPGGDMYTNHMEFIEWAREYDTGSVDMRSKAKHDQWQKLLLCKQIVLNGADALEGNFKKVQVEINSVIDKTVDRIIGDSKMKLLFGTGNQAKLSVMRSRLEKIGIELIGLSDLRAEGKSIPEVLENGNSPLENARLKALAYYKAFHMPVFSCDSGLYFDNVPDEAQPGVHVRNVNGKCLSDEEMMEYYVGLVRQYGNLIARYRNAICFVMDEKHIYESMDSSMDSEKFMLTDKPHSAIRKKGFPLDSMSIDMKTNQYYYDLSADELEQFAVEDGVLQFFKKVLNLR